MKIKEINKAIGFWISVYDVNGCREFVWPCGCRGTMMMIGDIAMVPCDRHIDTMCFKADDNLHFETRSQLLDIFKSTGD